MKYRYIISAALAITVGSLSALPVSAADTSWTTIESCEDRQTAIEEALEIKVQTHAEHDVLHAELQSLVNETLAEAQAVGIDNTRDLKVAMAQANTYKNNIDAAYVPMYASWEKLAATSCVSERHWLRALIAFQDKEEIFEEAGAVAKAHLTDTLDPLLLSLQQEIRKQ